MTIISGKSLWSVVCGTSILPSDEVVGEELEAASEHLAAGLLYYEPFTQRDHDSWASKVKLKDKQKDFVARIGKMFNLCSSQSWLLFQLFLQQEYRGSSSELMSALTSYRTESKLLHHLYTFYLTDPLHLLSCRTHLLASSTRKHPYQKLFGTYLRDILDKDKKLGVSLIKELQSVHDCITAHRDQQDELGMFTESDGGKSSSDVPHTALSFSKCNVDLPQNAELQWLCSRLAFAKHLLASLLVYYAAPHRVCPADAVHSLITMSLDGGVCGSAAAITAGAAVTSLLRDIDALHCLLLTLVINPEADTSTHILCDVSWREKLDPLFINLGSRPCHMPPLLAWSLVQGRHAIAELSSGGSVASAAGTGGPLAVHQYSKMAHRAIQGGVLSYLESVLKNEAVASDALLTELSSSITYALVCVIAAQLNLDASNSAINTNSLRQLVHSCLSSSIPAQLFWGEEAGGAGLLLPDALASFPNDPWMLLSLCTSLATANTASCDKVVEMLSDLPSMTWRVGDAALAASCREVGGAQVITHSPLHLMRSLTIGPHSSGTILPFNNSREYLVKWHVPTSAWQVILASLHAVDEEMSNGLTVTGWMVDMMEASLGLVAAVISTEPKHCSSFEHIIDQCVQLTIRLSSVLEPHASLVQRLMTVLAAVGQSDPQALWRRLDKCDLFPVLPHQRGENAAQYYRCGKLRSLVCGGEAMAGRYPTLTSYCELLAAAINAGMSNSSIRGGVIFLVREVVPHMIVQWSYVSSRERVKVLEAVMEVLHRVMEQNKADDDITAEVALQLCSAQSGGGTLRAVLEAGTSLEASLDAPPAQWPHATHATALARTAHLALSILHRLVLRYCCQPNNRPDAPESLHKQKLRELIAGDRKHNTAASLGGAFSGFISTGPPHLALTIAQYVHHRLNPRLPYLALRTLTKLAEQLGVPLVACLGSEADVIRELLLTRLSAATEDTRVKVAICKLLTAAVKSQPGLLRAFMSPPDSLMSVLTELIGAHNGLLDSINSVELTASIIELIGALWEANHAAAMTCLRKNSTFWTVLVKPLSSKTIKLPQTVLHHTLHLLAIEYFIAKKNHDGNLAAGLKEAFVPVLDYSSSDTPASCYISICDRITSVCSTGTVNEEDIQLLKDWRDLNGVILAAYPGTIAESNLSALCSDVLMAITSCLSNPEDPNLREATHLLSDALLFLTSYAAPSVVKGAEFWQQVTQTVEGLRATVLQTPAPTHMRLLSAVLKAVEHLPPHSSNNVEQTMEQQHLSSLLSSVRSVTEQHCSLVTLEDQEEHFCTNSAVLQVSCSLLHLCLHRLPPSATSDMLRNSHVVSALLHAATLLMQSHFLSHSSKVPVGAPEDVVCSVLSLLAVLARCPDASSNLSTQSIASTLALSLNTSQHHSVSASMLSHLVWVAINSLHKQGVSGVEGCVGIAAVHLTSLVDALSRPHQLPELAHAAGALTASLAPHYRLWIAAHSHTYSVLVEATAACVHMTTHLVRLRSSLERDALGKSVKCSLTGTSESVLGKKEDRSPTSVVLINKLLKVLLSCLQALRLLGPSLVDVLCTPSLDIKEWLPVLVQPSFRRATAAEPSQPNLGTLTTLLDICSTELIKDKQKVPYTQPLSRSSKKESEALSTKLLKEVAEEALGLLITQASLSLLNPDCSARDSRDIRTWLSDDLGSFFGSWLGVKRLSALSSPLPLSSPMSVGGFKGHSASSASFGSVDVKFLRLMQHLATTLCQHH